MAERWGQHQGGNPVRFVKFLPEDNLRFETLSAEQEKMLLLASPPYFRELIVFAINTGSGRAIFWACNGTRWISSRNA
jgi:hypothetical protein